MRRIVTAITAAALALSLVSMATPANAVTGYDSAYAGESAFLTLNAGQSGTFTVFFQNTGTTSWAKGTATQVDLAACMEDKVTCNAQDASEAPFTSGWLSTTRYATHTQTTVAPGSIGTFTYSVAVPAGQAAGTYRFNGALVLSATGADIHNEGYYQDVTVPTAVGSCTPTAITTTPTTAQNQVGVTHTQSATVTCAIPEGGTTAPASVGTQVTFIADAAATDTGNTDVTLTATTNDSGIATVTWTRSNPGTDTVAVYPTSTPAVRATATKRWVAGAFTLSCEPTAAATQLSGTARTFTVTVRNPATGALASGAQIDLTTTTSETASEWTTATTTVAGNAAPFTAGTSVQGTGGAATTITTASDGTASFTVTGNLAAGGTTGVITVRAFLENDTATFGGTANNTLDTTEFRVDCGATTFETLRAATITVTPDTTATNAANGNRVYTVTAVDQFGAAYTGTNVRFSFTEFTDADTSTTTVARVNTNFGGGTGVQAGGSSPTLLTNCPATATAANQNVLLAAGGNGTWYVMICSTASTTGTPQAWYDSDGNQVPSTGESQDTGGAKTWTTAASTTARLSPSSATNATSSETTLALNNSTGEEIFNASIRDQSGNLMDTTTDAVVTFTVRNTGASTVQILDCTGNTSSTGQGGGVGTVAGTNPIASGGSATCTAGILAASTPTTTTSFATVTIDTNPASGGGTATIDCTITIGSTTLVCTQATKTWVAQGTAIVNTGASTQTASGNVVAFDTTQDYYTIAATTGNFTIFYDASQTFTVDGSSATYAQFESNITIGDRIVFTGGAVATQPAARHQLTNQ